MSEVYILAEDGKTPVPSDTLTWGAWLGGNPEKRRVAVTELTDDVRVSTVFLGLDHRFGPEGPPVLWETMVFGGPLDQEQERYSTYDDAVKGHAEMVSRAEAAQRI